MRLKYHRHVTSRNQWSDIFIIINGFKHVRLDNSHITVYLKPTIAGGSSDVVIIGPGMYKHVENGIIIFNITNNSYSYNVTKQENNILLTYEYAKKTGTHFAECKKMDNHKNFVYIKYNYRTLLKYVIGASESSIQHVYISYDPKSGRCTKATINMNFEKARKLI